MDDKMSGDDVKRVCVHDRNHCCSWNKQRFTKTTIMDRKLVKIYNIEQMDLTKKMYAQFVPF